jgi:xylose isomerase
VPTSPTRFAYATRLNGFKADAATVWPGRNRITALDLIERAATVPGLSAVDFNFPDHLEGTTPRDIRAKLDGLGISLNGFAMRYYSDPGFKKGALSHPDKAIRAKALDLTLRGIDALAEAGGDLMTLWLGQDGFDYSFQADYLRLWDETAEALRVIAAHNPQIDISIEYKPNEPRAFSLLPDVATTLLMVRTSMRRTWVSRSISPMCSMPTRCRPMPRPSSTAGAASSASTSMTAMASATTGSWRAACM